MKKETDNNGVSRREFFSSLVPLLSVPAILWWVFTGTRDSNMGGVSKDISAGSDLPAGISFQQGVILVNDEEGVRAFEARCTHLGCRINKSEGDELVCPCHGSRFSLSGKAITGPAIKPLKSYSIIKDELSGNIIIQVR